MIWPVSGPDGTVYPNHCAAARALGVHVSTIRRHLDRYGHLEMVGQARTVPCIWRGKTYPSLTAAAAAAGVCPQVVSTLLRLRGNLDTLGVGRGRHRNKPACSVVTKLGRHEWPSRTAAARDLGTHAVTLSKWMSPAASPRQRDALLAALMRLDARSTERKAA